MQRHHSDSGAHFRTLQHVPQRPSRLNPALEGRRGSIPAALQGRGTVSMPTSPLRRNVVSPWAEPHSAQAFFGYTSNDEQGQMDIDPPSPFHSNQAGTDHSTPAHIANDYISPNSIQADPFHLISAPEPVLKSEEEYDQEDVQMLSAPHTPLGFDRHEMVHHQPFDLDHQQITGDSHQAEEEMEEDGHDHEETVQQIQSRRKRQQVRVACTHCQKACKKCSNTRPCERCVKYNLTDCVDSTRKPRKTGVKRGPYRSRKSISDSRTSVTHNPQSQSHMYDSSSSSHSKYDSQPIHKVQHIQSDSPGSGYGSHSEQNVTLPHVQGYGYSYHPQSVLAHSRRSQPPRQASPTPAPPPLDQHEILYARQQQQVYHLRQLQMREQLGQRHRQQSVYSRSVPRENPHVRSQSGPSQATSWSQMQRDHVQSDQTLSLSPTLPAPRQSKLESALSAALSGISTQPRWVNGQRVQVQEGAGTLTPQHPTVPFPLSLQKSGRGVDPFSRAVSPIKTFQFGSRVVDDIPSGTSERANYDVTNANYKDHTDGTGRDSDNYHPYQASHQIGSSQPTWPSSQTETTTISLKRVRKPSLRTLMVPGISREGSPVDHSNSPGAGPLSGNWKPGLAMVADFEGRNVLAEDGTKRDGTMSPTLFQGDVEGVEDIQWGF